MTTKKLTKLLALYLPYILLGLVATNFGEAWRLAEGKELGDKIMAMMGTIPLAFANPLPSLHLLDLLIGFSCGAGLRLAVYLRSKNAKKYRHGMEYGSARWGTAKDIEPFQAPKFADNIILTKTERLMMSNRPPDPKNARNKNVLVVGGSGSGKTRFWLKPNLLQCHSSYVVTDPKGTIVLECGQAMLKNGYKVKILNTISLNWKENLPMIKLVHHEMVINSKFLEVPRSYYQRHLNASRVKRIAAEFDERIANAPKVSYRDGHYYVFDGQHTIAARKLLNNNSDLNIVCKVYSGLTEQEEALLFAQQTGISAPLTAGAKLRAKIHGGDPEAIAFQSATQRAGFGLSFNQSHAKWKIACIATAFSEYRQHGERIYTDALRILAEAWEGDIDSLRSEVLQGVVRFIALYDHEYDPVRLIRQLKRTSPVTIYRSGQAMSGPNYQKYMHQILKAYNGSSRTKSLPIKQ